MCEIYHACGVVASSRMRLYQGSQVNWTPAIVVFSAEKCRLGLIPTNESNPPAEYVFNLASFFCLTMFHLRFHLLVCFTRLSVMTVEYLERFFSTWCVDFIAQKPPIFSGHFYYPRKAIFLYRILFPQLACQSPQWRGGRPRRRWRGGS